MVEIASFDKTQSLKSEISNRNGKIWDFSKINFDMHILSESRLFVTSQMSNHGERSFVD